MEPPGGFEPPPGAEYTRWQSAGPGGGGQEFHFGGTGFSDFFEQFFGGGSRYGFPEGFETEFQPGSAPQGQKRPRRGHDIEGDILVTLEEAMHGTVRPISMQSVNRQTGAAETHEFQVRIPPGATDGRRIRVSKQATLEGALIATGFPFRSDSPWVDEYLAMLKAVIQKASGIRRPGAAALDLAYVAAGRVDGFWELGLKPWDTAAGVLLITEAGGRIGTLTGDEYKLGPHIVGGTPKVFAALVQELAAHVPAGLK